METVPITDARPRAVSVAAFLSAPAREQLLTISAWLLTLALSILLGLASIEYQWSGLPLRFGGVDVHVTLYPPLVFATLWVIWFGFWWGFIPAYLATLTLSLYAGMPLGWALLFSFADPIGLAMFALGYHAIPIKPDLRSVTSIAFFALLAFVAGIFGSAGSFIWTYTVGIGRADLFPIWQGWWLGAFLQDLLLVAPALVLFTPALCRWRNHHSWVVAAKAPTYRSVLSTGAITLFGVLFYLHTTVRLSQGHLERQLSRSDPEQWRDAALGMAASADALYWVLLVMTLFLGFFGFQLFRHWTRTLHGTAVRLAGANSNLRREVAERKRAQNEMHGYAERLAQANAMLAELARTDELTGLYNRRYFTERANNELSRGHRQQRPTALLLLDLDHFKEINDTYGHATGDVALRAVAETIVGSLRQGDLAGRFGGEEFLIMLPETDLDEAIRVAERLRENVANLALHSDTAQFSVTVSIGVAICIEHEPRFERLLHYADEALYSAKDAGRNRIEVATEK